MDKHYSWKAWSLLLLLSLIWGSSFILIKRGLIGLSAIEVATLRIVAAFLVLLPFAINKVRTIKARQWKFVVLIGFASTFIPAFLFAIAQTQVSSSITGVLNALVPLFTAIIGMTIYQQRVNARGFLGIGLGLTGTIVLVLAGSRGDFSSFNLYALLIVLATIFYAINVNVVKYHLHELKPLTITSVSLMIVGALATIQLVFFTDFIEKLSGTSAQISSIGYIVLLGVLGTAIALIIFNKLVEMTNPLFTSSVTYIIPLVARFWGLLDRERLSMIHFLGISGILLGVYIANTSRRK